MQPRISTLFGDMKRKRKITPEDLNALVKYVEAADVAFAGLTKDVAHF
jgi:hypothetical protein